jgi:hypothetical protein
MRSDDEFNDEIDRLTKTQDDLILRAQRARWTVARLSQDIHRLANAVKTEKHAASAFEKTWPSRDGRRSGARVN